MRRAIGVTDRDRMSRNVLGGNSGSGKSTLARRLAHGCGAIKGVCLLMVVAFTPLACAKSPRAGLQRSCEAGEVDACYRLGAHLEYEAHDARAALPWYRMACERAHASACNN